MVRPKVATPGTTVTIMGRGFHPRAMVQVGAKKIKPTSVTPRRITFVVPPMQNPGPRPISVLMGRKALSGGMLRVRMGPPRAKMPPGARPGHPMKPGMHRHRRERWRKFRGRPAVFSYRPRMGKPGTRVVIHGRNFAPDAEVLFGPKLITGAKIRPNRIVFRIPRGHKDGLIHIRQKGLRHQLVVGMFDVKAGISRAERRKREMERKRLARKRWQAYQRKLAKSRAARWKAYNSRWEELRRTREDRRRKRLAAIRAAWKAKFLAHEQVRAELALHAGRMSRLRQMLRLAGVDGRGKLAVRIQLVMDREQARHKRRMASLKVGFSMEGVPR